MRCQGHFEVARDATSIQQCAQLCERDDQCSSFSMQLVGGKGCFLYSQDSVCQTEQGWSTGHKGKLEGKVPRPPVPLNRFGDRNSYVNNAATETPPEKLKNTVLSF